MSEKEFNDILAAGIEPLPEDWADFVWLRAETPEQAHAQHDDKVCAMQDWLNAGGPEKDTY